MNPWREILKALQAELDRLSQEIDGRAVLPNQVDVVLPAARFEKWAPILEGVAAELGEALVEWVAGSRRAWYDGSGPFLALRLDAEGDRLEIACEFARSVAGEPASTREESSRDAAPEVPPRQGTGARPVTHGSAADETEEPAPAADPPSVERLDIDAGLSRPLADGGSDPDAGIGEVDIGEAEESESRLSRIELD